MKIVVTADTHLPKKSRGLPEELRIDLLKSDLIIHAGDFQTIEIYQQLKDFGELIAVAGNVDHPDLKELLPQKMIIEKKGLKIGLVHGDGAGKTTEKRALETFQHDDVGVIIFGHSHIPFSRYQNGIFLFNPGSPTDKRKLPYFSHGILTIGDSWKIEHKFYV
ncbi:YfcE family phosphodiesterase (plasmid) [Cytobacillus spongiae]|uniref:metallophosphoesterase family protein n=1 Tax=Cytobacillus spongiae TaxID=2901381 RepID=UPI00145E1408|nr:YfcE family phosphodiesterase [Cytobacillus spongiae]MCA1062973.1 YfcE family phosphodiesterase [Rossellomorea aquimaris]NMH70306.1 YfcE family phosphodiesterase [Bacillus sp. RO3]UII58574.1 YfcE family phosphodiesterase [Cytobacillus spongiae]WJV28403.1 YfcE family phosphodiesterase [Rossellomorea sp. AcN35-11]